MGLGIGRSSLLPRARGKHNNNIICLPIMHAAGHTRLYGMVLLTILTYHTLYQRMWQRQSAASAQALFIYRVVEAALRVI